MIHLWLTPEDRELMSGTIYQSSHKRYWLTCVDFDGARRVETGMTDLACAHCNRPLDRSEIHSQDDNANPYCSKECARADPNEQA